MSDAMPVPEATKVKEVSVTVVFDDGKTITQVMSSDEVKVNMLLTQEIGTIDGPNGERLELLVSGRRQLAVLVSSTDLRKFREFTAVGAKVHDQSRQMEWPAEWSRK
jgi:hypothetical protein